MRQLVISSGLAVALCVPLAACGGGDSAPAVDTKAVAASIDQDATQLLEDFRSRDGAKIAAHYAPDAVLMIAGSPPSEGRDAIATNMAALGKDPAFALDFANKKTVVAASGDIAYAVGSYHVSYTDPTTKKAVNEAGNYVTVYKKQDDGSWKIQEDITSNSAPAAPADVSATPPEGPTAAAPGNRPHIVPIRRLGPAHR